MSRDIQLFLNCYRLSTTIGATQVMDGSKEDRAEKLYAWASKGDSEGRLFALRCAVETRSRSATTEGVLTKAEELYTLAKDGPKKPEPPKPTEAGEPAKVRRRGRRQSEAGSSEESAKAS
jgi:hypothetical protein